MTMAVIVDSDLCARPAAIGAAVLATPILRSRRQIRVAVPSDTDLCARTSALEADFLASRSLSRGGREDGHPADLRSRTDALEAVVSGDTDL